MLVDPVLPGSCLQEGNLGFSLHCLSLCPEALTAVTCNLGASCTEPPPVVRLPFINFSSPLGLGQDAVMDSTQLCYTWLVTGVGFGIPFLMEVAAKI